MLSSAGVLLLIEPEHDALVLDEAQRRGNRRRARVSYSSRKWLTSRAAEEALGDRFVAAGAEIVALEIAAAHVHAEGHVGRAPATASLMLSI